MAVAHIVPRLIVGGALRAQRPTRRAPTPWLALAAGLIAIVAAVAAFIAL